MFHQKKSNSITELNPGSKVLVDSADDKGSKSEITRKPKQPAKHNPFLGFFYTFVTSVLITLTSVFVKKLDYISPGHLSWVRNAGVFCGCLPIAIYCVKDVFGPKKDRWMLLLRGFMGATSLYMNLTAFRYLPLAEAAIIMSTVPALTTIVARFYLKETCGRVQIFGLVLTLCGVLLSVRLPELLSNRHSTHFDSVYLGGLAAAVVCVIILSLTFVFLRKMKHIHFSVTLLYFGVIGMLENGVINIATATFVYPACGWDVILIMLIGILGFMGHCTLTLAVQAEAVGIVTVTKASLDIIVAMIFQVIFFSVDIDAYNSIGATLVIVSVSMMGFNKWLQMLPDESKTKEKFKCLLL